MYKPSIYWESLLKADSFSSLESDFTIEQHKVNKLVRYLDSCNEITENVVSILDTLSTRLDELSKDLSQSHEISKNLQNKRNVYMGDLKQLDEYQKHFNLVDSARKNIKSSSIKSHTEEFPLYLVALDELFKVLEFFKTHPFSERKTLEQKVDNLVSIGIKRALDDFNAKFNIFCHPQDLFKQFPLFQSHVHLYSCLQWYHIIFNDTDKFLSETLSIIDKFPTYGPKMPHYSIFPKEVVNILKNVVIELNRFDNTEYLDVIETNLLSFITQSLSFVTPWSNSITFSSLIQKSLIFLNNNQNYQDIHLYYSAAFRHLEDNGIINESSGINSSSGSFPTTSVYQSSNKSRHSQRSQQSSHDGTSSHGTGDITQRTQGTPDTSENTFQNPPHSPIIHPLNHQYLHNPPTQSDDNFDKMPSLSMFLDSFESPSFSFDSSPTSSNTPSSSRLVTGSGKRFMPSTSKLRKQAQPVFHGNSSSVKSSKSSYALWTQKQGNMNKTAVSFHSSSHRSDSKGSFDDIESQSTFVQSPRSQTSNSSHPSQFSNEASDGNNLSSSPGIYSVSEVTAPLSLLDSPENLPNENNSTVQISETDPDKNPLDLIDNPLDLLSLLDQTKQTSLKNTIDADTANLKIKIPNLIDHPVHSDISSPPPGKKLVKKRSKILKFMRRAPKQPNSSSKSSNLGNQATVKGNTDSPGLPPPSPTGSNKYDYILNKLSPRSTSSNRKSFDATPQTSREHQKNSFHLPKSSRSGSLGRNSSSKIAPKIKLKKSSLGRKSGRNLSSGHSSGKKIISPRSRRKLSLEIPSFGSAPHKNNMWNSKNPDSFSENPHKSPRIRRTSIDSSTRIIEDTASASVSIITSTATLQSPHKIAMFQQSNLDPVGLWSPLHWPQKTHDAIIPLIHELRFQTPSRCNAPLPRWDHPFIYSISVAFFMLASSRSLVTQLVPNSMFHSIYPKIAQTVIEWLCDGGDILMRRLASPLMFPEENVFSLLQTLDHFIRLKPFFHNVLTQDPVTISLQELFSIKSCQHRSSIQLQQSMQRSPVPSETYKMFLDMLQNLTQKANQNLEDVLDQLLNHDLKSRPKSGTVHEVTTNVLPFIKTLISHRSLLKEILPPPQTPSEPEWSEIDSLKDWDILFFPEHPNIPEEQLADLKEMSAVVVFAPVREYLIEILKRFEANLRGKAAGYKDTSLASLFLLNNLRHILKTLLFYEDPQSQTSSLLGLVGSRIALNYLEKIRTLEDSYIKSTFSSIFDVLQLPTEGPSLQKNLKLNRSQRHLIKEKYTTFNNQFESILKTHSKYHVPDPEVLYRIRSLVHNLIVPRYESFYNYYLNIPFSVKNKEHYQKYTPKDVSSLLGQHLLGPDAAKALSQIESKL